jgi:hypothetical protein
MKFLSKKVGGIPPALCKIGERLLNILISPQKCLKKQKLYGKIRILAFYFVYSMKKQGINTYRYGSFLPN